MYRVKQLELRIALSEIVHHADTALRALNHYKDCVDSSKSVGQLRPCRYTLVPALWKPPCKDNQHKMCATDTPDSVERVCIQQTRLSDQRLSLVLRIFWCKG